MISEFIENNLELWLNYAWDAGLDKVNFEKELRCFAGYFRK